MYVGYKLNETSLCLFLVANMSEKDGFQHNVNKTRGIITLYRHQRAAFAITSKRGPSPRLHKSSPNDLPQSSFISAETDEVRFKNTFKSICAFFKFIIIFIEQTLHLCSFRECYSGCSWYWLFCIMFVTSSAVILDCSIFTPPGLDRNIRSLSCRPAVTNVVARQARAGLF